MVGRGGVTMSDGYADIPGTQPAKPESLGPVTPVNRSLYMAVIIVLGIVLVAGVVGWIVLAIDNRTMPQGLDVLLGAIGGGLVGLISGKSSG